MTFDSSPALSRRDREKEQRRQEILAAAERVFCLNGFETASIDKIAKEAELATGTLYLYFKDKESLFAAMVANKIACLVEDVRTAVAGVPSSDPVGGIKNAIRAQFEFHAKNQGFFEVILRHHKGPPPQRKEDWDSIRQTIDKHEAILVELIKRAQKLKILRKGAAHSYATALLGSIIHLTRTMNEDSKKAQSHTEQADFVFDLFVNGAKQ